MSQRVARAERRASGKRGPIRPGERRARRWGFTPDRWDEASYLWIDGDRVVLSLVTARESGRGYLRDLVAAIERDGRRVAVPTPLPAMESILRRWGFEAHVEMDPQFGPVEVWERDSVPSRGSES